MQLWELNNVLLSKPWHAVLKKRSAQDNTDPSSCQHRLEWSAYDHLVCILPVEEKSSENTKCLIPKKKKGKEWMYK